MNDLHNPDLSFPMMDHGKQETPPDLYSLLYLGGCRVKITKVKTLIALGELGAPIVGRLSLVEGLHEVIAGKLTEGGSRHTVKSSIETLRRFFSWADREGWPLTLETIANTYIGYADHLQNRHKIIKDMSERTAYKEACLIARILDQVLHLRASLRYRMCISLPRAPKRTRGTQAHKQNLERAFQFGHALLDIADALSVETIRGPLPVRIHLRTGQVIEEWSTLRSPDKVKALIDEDALPYARKVVIDSRTAWESDTSLRTRYPLANLRIQVELLIFIAQTGMNLSQAHSLKMGKFSYRSHLDGYQVHRVYKGRRQGEVAFDIFNEYRVIFERYLAWRETMFPGDDQGLLFPFVNRFGRGSDKALAVAPKFHSLRSRCKRLGVDFIAPSKLRNIRVNWMLRRSLDPGLTAEMNQHTQETLIRFYEQPNLQVAMIEITRFHARTDPAIAPPGPGFCVEAVPQAMEGVPAEATLPDCISPAGCLFCEHQRDVDSNDHAWSLASYRYLKTLELARYRPPSEDHSPHPAAAAIGRLTAKLKAFEESSEVRGMWVGEALARVEEEYYHPRWDGFILLMEARA